MAYVIGLWFKAGQDRSRSWRLSGFVDEGRQLIKQVNILVFTYCPCTYTLIRRSPYLTYSAHRTITTSHSVTFTPQPRHTTSHSPAARAAPLASSCLDSLLTPLTPGGRPRPLLSNNICRCRIQINIIPYKSIVHINIINSPKIL